MARFLILSTCLFLILSDLSGQSLEWVFSKQIDTQLSDRLPAEVGSVEDLKLLSSQGISLLQNNGYLLARITNIEQSETAIKFYVTPGERFEWANLDGGNLPLPIQNRVGFRPGRYDLTPVSQRALESLFEKILREAERSGHPFALVRLDSVEIRENKVFAKILYEEGDVVYYDRLVVDSSFVKPRWLESYLDLRQGDVYDQRAVNNLGARLDALEFIALKSNPSVYFSSDKAVVSLPVQRRASNRVDAVIGFLPNEENDGGLRITGEAELHLANLFNSGKTFDLHWQRMRPETQYLELGYFHPNIFRSNLNVSVGFDLLKEDTTFTTRDFDLRLDYRSGHHVVSFMSRFRAARVLNAVEDITGLPEIADFNQNDYGAGYTYERRDAGWLGFKGFRGSAEFLVGSKQLRDNPAYPDDIYDGIDRNIFQLSSGANVQWGFLTGRRTLLYQHLRTGWLNSDRLFMNDLYRLGGFRTIRGFNENQFFAERYLLYSAEWQLYFDESSNILLFVDQAFIRSLNGNNNPTGIGVGLSLQTGNGLLQLAYAVGRDQNQPFDFRLSKFHFGYKAKF